MEINLMVEDHEFSIAHHKSNDGNRILVLIFVSAGGAAFGNKDVNEFFNSFRRSNFYGKFDICWIKDKKIVWYNFTTDKCTLTLKEICLNYDAIYALGESMGASAALLFGNLINVNRILAFGPQFCIADPFIRFNVELNLPDINSFIKTNIYNFDNIKKSSLLVFGAESWQDYIHGLIFKDNGYNVKYLSGSGHSVASFLKINDILVKIIDIFLNPDEPDFLEAINFALETYMIEKPNIDCAIFGRV